MSSPLAPLTDEDDDGTMGTATDLSDAEFDDMDDSMGEGGEFLLCERDDLGYSSLCGWP